MSYGSEFAKVTVLGVFTIWLHFLKISIAQRFLLYWDISVYPYVISNTWKLYNLHHLRHEMGQELFLKLFAHEPIRHLAVVYERRKKQLLSNISREIGRLAQERSTGVGNNSFLYNTDCVWEACRAVLQAGGILCEVIKIKIKILFLQRRQCLHLYRSSLG